MFIVQLWSTVTLKGTKHYQSNDSVFILSLNEDGWTIALFPFQAHKETYLICFFALHLCDIRKVRVLDPNQYFRWTKLPLSFSFSLSSVLFPSLSPMSSRNNGPATKFHIEASWNEAHGTYRANGKLDLFSFHCLLPRQWTRILIPLCRPNATSQDAQVYIL